MTSCDLETHRVIDICACSPPGPGRVIPKVEEMSEHGNDPYVISVFINGGIDRKSDVLRPWTDSLWTHTVSWRVFCGQQTESVDAAFSSGDPDN